MISIKDDKMMNFFRKNYEIVAPISGRVIELSKVKDRVFATKMAGDGVGILADGDIVYAPADGVVSLIFESNHAIGMTLDNGIELLVHLGIDTVELKGEGFTRLIAEGARVKAGEPVLKIDKDFIVSEGYSLATPVLITNTDMVKELKYNVGIEAVGGETVIMTYRI